MDLELHVESIVAEVDEMNVEPGWCPESDNPSVIENERENVLMKQLEALSNRVMQGRLVSVTTSLTELEERLGHQMTTLSEDMDRRLQDVDRRQMQTEVRMLELIQVNTERTLQIDHTESNLKGKGSEVSKKVNVPDPDYTWSKAVIKANTVPSAYATCVEVNDGNGTSMAPDQVIRGGPRRSARLRERQQGGKTFSQ